jgi:hypothetical protein
VRFEHLVEVNDARNPLVAVVTREQLWRGLVLRAEQPQLFVPQLSEATILTRTEAGLVRALRYGDALVTDDVSFVPLERVRYDIAPQGEIPRSSLTMSIEEPRPRALFVRFVYDDESSAAEDTVIDELRRAAYEDADIDTVGMIRWLAESGRLDE